MRWECLVVQVRNCYVFGVQGEKGKGQMYNADNGPTIPDQLCDLGRDRWKAVAALPTFDEPNDYHILMKRNLTDDAPHQGQDLKPEELRKLLGPFN